MKDYWNELNLPQKWSKKERFNFIMAYIDEQLGVEDDDD